MDSDPDVELIDEDLPEPEPPKPIRQLWAERDDRGPAPPDHLGTAVRFGCGAIFGVFLFAGFFVIDPSMMTVPAFAGAASICGLGAAVLGDNFWKIGYIIWPFGLKR